MKRIITLLLAILILTTGFFSNVSLTFAEEAGVGINENLSSDNENALLNNAELPNETANEEQAAQSEETLQNELNAEEKTDESETAASESDVSGQENISEESFSENEQPALMRGGPSRAGLYVISCEEDPDYRFVTDNYADLDSEIRKLATNNKSYVLNLNADLVVAEMSSLTLFGNTWLVEGNGHSITKEKSSTYAPGTTASAVLSLSMSPQVTLKNVVVDGTNEYIVAEIANGSLTLESGAVLQNGYTTESKTSGVHMHPNTELVLKSNSKILNNISALENSYGGAIYMQEGCAVDIDGAELSGNKVKQSGGAVYVPKTARSFKAKNAEFKDNEAKFGGAVFIEIESTIENTDFSNNKATSQGGAVYSDAATSISGSSFTANTASSRGGAIMKRNGTLDISGSSFNSNKSKFGGAIGIHLNAGATNISGSTFQNNAAQFGGAVSRYVYYNEPPANPLSKITISESDFVANKAPSAGQGGALYLCGDADIISSNFSENSSGFQGGAAYFLHGNMNVEGSSFKNNDSYHAGGAIGLYDGGSLTIKKSEFIGNKQPQQTKTREPAERFSPETHPAICQ